MGVKQASLSSLWVIFLEHIGQKYAYSIARMPHIGIQILAVFRMFVPWT